MTTRGFIPGIFGYMILTITASASFASSFHDSTDGIPEAAHEAWNATVFLDARFLAKNPQRHVSSTGAGTVVAQGARASPPDPPRAGRGKSLLIVTNAHVVPCEGACVIRARFGKAGRTGTVSSRARIVWSDSRMDLALLEARVPRGALVRTARLADTFPAPPFRVLAIGFPDLTLQGDAAVHSSKRVKVFSTGSVLEAPEGFRADYHALASTEATGRLEPGSVLIHSAALLPGSSGGPLIDSQGRVIGINTGSLARARDSKCVVRSTGEGPRCVHLAIPVDVLIGKISDWKNARLVADSP